MATTTYYRFELLFHRIRTKRRKRVERGLMYIAGKPQKKILIYEASTVLCFYGLEKRF